MAIKQQYQSLCLMVKVVALTIFVLALGVMVNVPQVAARAQEIVIEAEGAYTYAPPESLTLARFKALESARDEAVNKMGSYLESYSRAQNGRLSLDDIKLVVADLVTIKGEPIYEEQAGVKGTICKVRASFVLDDSQLAQVRERAQDVSVRQENILLRRQSEALQSDYEKLGRDNHSSQQMADNLKKRESFQYLALSHNPNLPIMEREKLVKHALDLDPQNSLAHLQYIKLSPYERTAEEYMKALDLISEDKSLQKNKNAWMICTFDGFSLFACWLYTHECPEDAENAWQLAQSLETVIDWSGGYDTYRLRPRMHILQRNIGWMKLLDVENFSDEDFKLRAAPIAENYVGKHVRECLAILEAYPDIPAVQVDRGYYESAMSVYQAMCGHQTLYNKYRRKALSRNMGPMASTTELHKEVAEKFLLQYAARGIPTD